MAAECGCGSGALRPCGELGGGAVYEWAKQNISRYYLPIIIGVVAMLLGVAIGYSLGLRNAGTDVSDNGNGIDDVRNELSTAQEHQRQITDRLESAVQRSDNAAERAERIEERAVRSETAVNDAGVLIDECQQILGRVRNRGQAHPVKN